VTYGTRVGLELVQVDVEGTIEAEGGSDGRDDLRNQSVQIGEARLRDIEALFADIVDGLIVHLSSDHRSTSQPWHQKLARIYAP